MPSTMKKFQEIASLSLAIGGRKVHNSVDQAWMQLAQDVLTNGETVNPRGEATKEILGAKATFWMDFPILSMPDRRLGYRFMAREAWWILSGRNDVKSIKDYASISRFSDDGIYFFGAYGPRIIDQMPYVLRTLRNDRYSRQAVMTIWRESPMASKDIPCSITCQFMIRKNLLHVFLNMRSSDIWLGVPYDWFNFSMLGAYVALALKDKYIDLKLGQLHYYAASSHLYAWNEPTLLECSNTIRKYEPLSIDDFACQDHLVEHLQYLSEGKPLAIPFGNELSSWSNRDVNERT